ncbi:hypothetical protein T10_7095 [Trichinella papuae]|uniref:Uncharacterized protein n=1 Tax=Trichinella papuae TaxID=268474 RepID=A0A0V1N7W7_9BILA|nr:hypothetical protein T10_7095 [Trichinella papuae]
MTSLALFLCALAAYLQLSAADRTSVRKVKEPVLSAFATDSVLLKRFYKYEGTLGHSMVE